MCWCRRLIHSSVHIHHNGDDCFTPVFFLHDFAVKKTYPWGCSSGHCQKVTQFIPTLTKSVIIHPKAETTCTAVMKMLFLYTGSCFAEIEKWGLFLGAQPDKTLIMLSEWTVADLALIEEVGRSFSTVRTEKYACEAAEKSRRSYYSLSAHADSFQTEHQSVDLNAFSNYFPQLQLNMQFKRWEQAWISHVFWVITGEFADDLFVLFEFRFVCSCSWWSISKKLLMKITWSYYWFI